MSHFSDWPAWADKVGQPKLLASASASVAATGPNQTISQEERKVISEGEINPKSWHYKVKRIGRGNHEPQQFASDRCLSINSTIIINGVTCRVIESLEDSADGHETEGH